jgi:hypothetical protein
MIESLSYYLLLEFGEFGVGLESRIISLTSHHIGYFVFLGALLCFCGVITSGLCASQSTFFRTRSAIALSNFVFKGLRGEINFITHLSLTFS